MILEKNNNRILEKIIKIILTIFLKKKNYGMDKIKINFIKLYRIILTYNINLIQLKNAKKNSYKLLIWN